MKHYSHTDRIRGLVESGQWISGSQVMLSEP